MNVEFRTKSLKSQYDDPRRATRKWGQQIGGRYARVVTLIMAAQDFRDLYEIPSIRLHQLVGNREGEHALWLNRQWRLIVEHDEDRRTVIIKEVSKHYGD